MLVAEGRPEGAGFQAAAVLAKAGVPVTVVLDSAVGYHMEVADLCVTGAEGVLENGGIINKVHLQVYGCVPKVLFLLLFLLGSSRVYCQEGKIAAGGRPLLQGACCHAR